MKQRKQKEMGKRSTGNDRDTTGVYTPEIIQRMHAEESPHSLGAPKVICDFLILFYICFLIQFSYFFRVFILEEREQEAPANQQRYQAALCVLRRPFSYCASRRSNISNTRSSNISSNGCKNQDPRTSRAAKEPQGPRR